MGYGGNKMIEDSFWAYQPYRTRRDLHDCVRSNQHCGGDRGNGRPIPRKEKVRKKDEN